MTKKENIQLSCLRALRKKKLPNLIPPSSATFIAFTAQEYSNTYPSSTSIWWGFLSLPSYQAVSSRSSPRQVKLFFPNLPSNTSTCYFKPMPSGFWPLSFLLSTSPVTPEVGYCLIEGQRISREENVRTLQRVRDMLVANCEMIHFDRKKTRKKYITLMVQDYIALRWEESGCPCASFTQGQCADLLIN